MYLPAVHEETNTSLLHQLIHEYPLGVLTTAIKSKSFPLIQASHIPWLLDASTGDGENDMGRLRGHLARQNPQAKAMIEAIESASGELPSRVLEEDVHVLFTAPHHYITPKFYTETKPATGRVVPTWNYAAVEVYGKATLYFDPQSAATSEFLSQQISDLSAHAEISLMGYSGSGNRQKPWEVADAPESYINIMMKNIIGIEIAIHQIQGKFKMSQEKRKGDRQGVVKGLEDLGSDVGAQLATIIQTRGDLKDAAKIKEKDANRN